MRKDTMKKSICAALAALMTVMTAGCGEVRESPAYPDSETTAAMTAQTKADAEESGEAEAPEESSAAEETPDQEAESITEEASDEPTDEKTAADLDPAYMQYSTDLFKASCLEDIKAGKNVMISPESVAYALALAENGMDGDTLAQTQALFGGVSIDEQNKKFSERISKADQSDDVKFNIADSVWIKAGMVDLAPEYSENIQNYLNAECYEDPFDSGAADRINSWVNDNTNGMIPNIITPDAIDDMTRAVLVNAISFEAEWSEEYEDKDITDDVDFTSADGKTQKCTMLHSKENDFLKCDGAVGFAKMYKGEDYAFVALLPDEGTTAADFVSGLDGEKLEALWKNRDTSKDVIVEMPEFKGDHSVTLNDTLKSLGMTDAFDGSKADFSKMTAEKNELYISEVLHKTHIEVDRKGTKAAAATEITMRTAGIAQADSFKRVTLDRPFVYMIVDTENGMPVFMGVVNSIE